MLLLFRSGVEFNFTLEHVSVTQVTTEPVDRDQI